VKRVCSAIAVLLTTLSSWASAQATTLERTVKAQSGKDVAVGAYLNIRPNCTSGALPAIRLLNAPAHGKVTVKQAKARATNYKQCLAVEVPAYIAIYRSEPDFTGTDFFTVEIKYPAGKSDIEKVTVMVLGQGRNI
jgi:hypothetical protein